VWFAVVLGCWCAFWSLLTRHGGLLLLWGGLLSRMPMRVGSLQRVRRAGGWSVISHRSWPGLRGVGGGGPCRRLAAAPPRLRVCLGGACVRCSVAVLIAGPMPLPRLRDWWWLVLGERASRSCARSCAWLREAAMRCNGVRLVRGGRGRRWARHSPACVCAAARVWAWRGSCGAHPQSSPPATRSLP
jgi:hypothetical protein